MRRAVNGVRRLMKDGDELASADSPEFKAAHSRYRAARDRFTELARIDLGHGSLR